MIRTSCAAPAPASAPAVLVALLALVAPLQPSPAQGVPTPKEHLGFEVGADRSLADWPQIVAYFRKLALASPAVKLDSLGTTTQGRPFVVATISSPANIRQLDSLRERQARLADPRKLTAEDEHSLVATQPSVVLISCNIHATEIASSQMAMELAWRLATNDTLQRALEKTIVLLVPSMNPDGADMVVDWYRKGLGGKHEGGPLPWLYHHYVGHDNNRDWFMVTQKETKLVTDLLYREWFPEVFYDVHQMGNAGARLFVPPFVDPINPNVDPLIVRAIAHIGAEMALALEERGKRGVADQVIYDLWWHGGARSTPTRHNMVGILTEAASVRIATPITQDSSALRGHARGLPRYATRMNFPNPWPGGTWRLRDIVDYELIASEALVKMMSQQREQYVRNFVALGRKAVRLGETQPPYAFVIPRQADGGAVRELERVLRDGGVELRSASDSFAVGGRKFGPGTTVVSMAQPYRAHVKDLMEPQRFPRLEQWPGGPAEQPYDVAGWTLPLQMGVSVVPVTEPLAVPSVAENGVAGGCPRSAAGGYVALDARDTRSYGDVARVLKAGRRLRVAAARRGTAARFVIADRQGAPAGDGDACRYRSTLSSLPAGRTLARFPRVGLYRPWTSNMDEGWTRWLFDRFEIPYRSVTDSAVRAGNLRDHFDVLLVPDMSLRQMREGMADSVIPAPYAGGLGAAGVDAIAAFVRGGGTLVLLDRASELATEALKVPVRRILVPPRRGTDAPAAASDPQNPDGLYAPGSVLRVLVDATHPVAFGMPDTAAAYFVNSTTFDVTDSAAVRVIARYPRNAGEILLSGYLSGAESIAGRAAAVEARVGSGRVVMFGFRPQHRGQSYGTFKMLFNALLLGAWAER